jgi:hypothetical protein
MKVLKNNCYKHKGILWWLLLMWWDMNCNRIWLKFFDLFGNLSRNKMGLWYVLMVAELWLLLLLSMTRDHRNCVISIEEWIAKIIFG